MLDVFASVLVSALGSDSMYAFTAQQIASAASMYELFLCNFSGFLCGEVTKRIA